MRGVVSFILRCYARPMSTQPATPVEVYASLVGRIDEASVQRITQNLSPGTAPTANISRLHVLFQSSGGIVGDGVFLYNYFRSFPIELIFYNSGTIASIGVVAFLGAQGRKASASATFMIHRTSYNSQAASAAVLGGL